MNENYDVIVAGGGVAGVAAALAAAKAGARTAIIEKSVWWGGLATGGMIFIYLPLCDGCGNQVSAGLAEKLLHASIKYGPGNINPQWREPGSPVRYRTAFSPAGFVMAMDELLEKHKIDLWLDTLVSGCTVKENRVTGLKVLNKSGKHTLTGRVVVDATGDAEIIRQAGGSFVEGANSLAMWAIQAMEHCGEPPVSGHKLSTHIGSAINGQIEPFSWNAPPNKRRGTNGRAVTEFVMDSRRWLREYYNRNYAEGVYNRENLYALTLPTMAQFRRIARIVSRGGIPELGYNTPIDGSIGVSADWCHSKVVQEIPFSAMLPEKVEGVIVAGRAIDASGYSWELIRSIPAVAVSGEAAGTAAAMAAESNISPHLLPVRTLQDRLRLNGCLISMGEIGINYCDFRPVSADEKGH
ncbi:MAG: FAD-dependent oxidoreductase [Victivallaceae bacterium]